MRKVRSLKHLPPYAPPSGLVRIIHQDKDVIIVTKPAGLLSVPGLADGADDCLETRLSMQVSGALLIHRLDMDTSGIMVFAANKSAQVHINRQFERRFVDKTYIADLEGELTPEHGVVDLPLISDWPNRPLQMVCHERGKQAITKWQVISRQNGRTRVALWPKTGRSHQLRVHMLSLGHPIVGDPFYGDPSSAARMHLHAMRLEFHHPDGGARMAFEDPVPFAL